MLIEREDKSMKKIVPEYKIQNKGHYSPGILSNGVLYISGQLSRDPDTGEVASGRIYISDIDMWDEVNEAYSEFFADHKPARCVVPCGKLHFGCLVEIEVVAEVPK